MASKMKKKDIDEYIKSKSVTQSSYTAPTVQTHVDTRTPAMVQVAQTVKPRVAETTQNLKIADNNLKVAQDIYRNKLADEIKKDGQDYRTKFDDVTSNKISYQTKSEDKPSTQPKIIPIQEANKNLQNEIKNIQTEYDKWKLANYENNAAKAAASETTLFDKTIGTPIRAISDLLSPLTTGEDNIITDEQGNKTFLPSYSELKQEQVKKDSSKLGGFLQDIGYNATKILGAGAIDAVSGGLGGKALYWTDMATDNYKNAINRGYTGKQAVANTIISTGSEFLTEKLLGGVSKTLTGGKASELQSGISKAVNKLINNPKYANIIGSMGAEGTEEFVQEWISALNNKITLGEDIDYEQTLKDALYSFGVGAGSGGVVTGTIGGGLAPEEFNPQSKLNNLNESELNTLRDITTKRKNGEQLNEQDISNLQELRKKANTPQNQPTQAETVQPNAIPQETQKVTQNEQKSISERNKQAEQEYNDWYSQTLKESSNNVSPGQQLVQENNVSDRKTNAIQYDNPEIKKYYQDVAQVIAAEASIAEDSATQGGLNLLNEGMVDERYQRTGSTSGFMGGDLANFARENHLTAKQVSKAANDIIEDDGKENNANAKKLEKVIDARLRAGYTDPFGESFSPNQNYINEMEEIAFEKENKEARESLASSETPIKSNEETNNLNLSEKTDEQVIKAKAEDNSDVNLKRTKNKNVYEKEIKKPKDTKTIIPKEAIEKQLLKLDNGTKVSNLYSNITENSKFITQENMDKLSQEEIWRYAPQTNKETMQKASEMIGDTQKSVENAYLKFLSKGENFTPEDVAQGWILLKRFQDAGNYDAMVQVAKKMRNIATKSGQTVQMFNIQSRLTPEGMVKYAQSELMDAEQAFNKGKSQKEIEKYAKNFELTGEEVEYIKNQMEKIQNMEDGRGKNVEMAKINKMLSDKLPHKRGDSIKAWMRISMLFNPKTQVRNIAGNALITPINALADVSASMVDRAISKKTGTRTIGAPSVEGALDYSKGFIKGGKEAIEDYKMGIDTKDVDMSRFDITQAKPFVEDHKGLAAILNPFSKVGNKANDILDLVMSGGDRVFYQGAFESSLKNQMRLNNVDVPTQDMIDIATQEALSRTWNDNNGYTQFVLNTRRGLNKLNIGGYGLGDVLIPFAKTPANLTKAIYEYSPAGLASTIFKAKEINNAIETGQITPQMQHNFAQNIGKGVAGTMLYGLAYVLAENGIATGSKDDDKDVANFIRNTMGIQPYSIKIGKKSFTYDWAQPIAAPLAIVTDAYKNLAGKSDEKMATKIFNTILDVSNTGLNVLMQQSFLSGIAEVLNDNEGVVNGIMNQVLSLPARAIPTLFKQINDMFDTTQRTAYEKDRPLTTAKQNAQAKTPWSKELAPSVDTLGNEIEKYGGDKNKITYAIKSFLSPANQSRARVSETADEIYKVYEATGDKTIMPRVAPYYIQNKSVGRIDLSSKDRAEYQKTSGKLVNEALVDLINNEEYNDLSDDKKAEVISRIVGYADAKAKEDITGQISSYYKSADKKISSGMGIADYYLSKVK